MEHFERKHGCAPKRVARTVRKRVDGGGKYDKHLYENFAVTDLRCFGCDKQFSLSDPLRDDQGVHTHAMQRLAIHLRLVSAAGKLEQHVVIGSARERLGSKAPAGDGSVSEMLQRYNQADHRFYRTAGKEALP